MAKLYGRFHGEATLVLHSGCLSQFGGVRLVTLGDWVERGMRLLEFRSAAAR